MPSAQGRLVLITGAASGIGRAAVEAFLGHGDRVVAVDRAADGLVALQSELGNPPQLSDLTADVTDPGSVDAMVRQVLDGQGVPDVLLASAGIALDALFTQTSDDAMARVFDVNFFGVVRSVRPFVAPMVERGSGRILIMSSLVGKRGTPYYSIYAASKFALHGMADALRSELAGSGVSVGLICPGSTETPLQSHALREGPGQKRVRPGRMSAQTVARAIVRMADSRQPELVFPWVAKLLCAVDAIAPRLVDRILARLLKS